MHPAIRHGCVAGGHKVVNSKGRVVAISPVLWSIEGKSFLAHIASARMGHSGQIVGRIVSVTDEEGVFDESAEDAMRFCLNKYLVQA